VSQRNSADTRSGEFVQKQQLNVYTVMLMVAFFAITTACLLLYLELRRWGSFPWWKAESGVSTSYLLPIESGEPSPVRTRPDAAPTRWV
jgi:hypothetical protein